MTLLRLSSSQNIEKTKCTNHNVISKKSDRTNFFKQRKKFHNLRAHHFQSSQLVEEEVTLPGIDKERGEETSNNESLIFLNESLTPTNRRLLKEAKKASRQHNYKYKGYTVNGEVRVKKKLSWWSHCHTMLKGFGENCMKSRTGLCVTIFFVVWSSVLLTVMITTSFLIVWLNILSL